MILAIYIGSVAGYFWIDSSAHTLKPRNLDTADGTVVLLELTAIHPIDNRVDVDVLVIPQKGFLDPVRKSHYRHGRAAVSVRRVRGAVLS